MRIACPACNAAYQVPDEQLGEGRIVRCVRCGTDWAPIEAIPASEAEPSRKPEPSPSVVEAKMPVPTPEPVVERRMAVEEEIPIPRPPVLPAPPPAKRGPVLLVLAWIVSLGLVGAAVAGLYVGRERVMTIWPPSVRAYAALRLVGHPPTASEGHEPTPSAAHEPAPSEGRE